MRGRGRGARGRGATRGKPRTGVIRLPPRPTVPQPQPVHAPNEVTPSSSLADTPTRPRQSSRIIHATRNADPGMPLSWQLHLLPGADRGRLQGSLKACAQGLLFVIL